jgi:cytoskeletal protein CcmA (bactofilin family)
MFSSRKDEKTVVPPPPPPMQASAGMKRTRSAAPSIISADLTIAGTLTSTGDIQIDGRIEGDVHSAGLVIGDKAFIHGDVVAEEVTVRGRVQGGIRARKVLLASTCHVEGNILHEAFAVETGAFFEGNCRHADNPLGDDVSKKAAAPAPVAAPIPAASTVPATSSMVTRPATSASPTATFTPLKAN